MEATMRRSMVMLRVTAISTRSSAALKPLVPHQRAYHEQRYGDGLAQNGLLSTVVCKNIFPRLSTPVDRRSWSHHQIPSPNWNIGARSIHASFPCPSQDSEKESKVKTEEQPAKPVSKLRMLMQTYGRTALAVYIGIWGFSLSTCYVVVTSGVDVEGMLMYFGFELETPNANTYGTAMLTYALHKMMAPVRIGATAVLTPPVANALKRRWPTRF